MKHLTYVTGIILSCCLIINCSKKSIEPAQSSIYFNSFESPADTTGWHNVDQEMFVNDPAPGGGIRSLDIGGGCIQPAAYLDLPIHLDKGFYAISCWGKTAEATQAGRIVLAKVTENGTGEVIEVTIDRKDWTFYRSKESLYCPANSKLRIEILIGGFVPASMFVDCIGIKKVK